MRTILVAIAMAGSAFLLAACAGGSLPGSSMMPATSPALHASDSMGGGLPGQGERVHHDSDSMGGGLPGQGERVHHNSDSMGGGLPGQGERVHHKSDSRGGGGPGQG